MGLSPRPDKLRIFNSPLEVGVRSLVILAEAFPSKLDLNRLVQFDYITLHTEDAGGPKSLHPPLPLRSGELTVRRGLIENGLLMMMSRSLVEQFPSVDDGFVYAAADASGPFISRLRSPYLVALREAAAWTVATFGESPPDKLRDLADGFFKQWSVEFDTANAGPMTRN